MNKKVNKNSKWIHFKGGIYIVKDFALNTETEEEMVLYYKENDESEKLFARPMSMFLSKVPNSDTDRFVLLVSDINKKQQILKSCQADNLYLSNYIPGIGLNLDIDFSIETHKSIPTNNRTVKDINEELKDLAIKRIDVVEPYNNSQIGTDISFADILHCIHIVMAGYNISYKDGIIKFTRKEA